MTHGAMAVRKIRVIAFVVVEQIARGKCSCTVRVHAQATILDAEQAATLRAFAFLNKGLTVCGAALTSAQDRQELALDMIRVAGVAMHRNAHSWRVKVLTANGVRPSA